MFEHLVLMECAILYWSGFIDLSLIIMISKKLTPYTYRRIMCDVIACIFWLWIILVFLHRLRASARSLIVHAIMNYPPFHRCDYGSRVTVHV